MKNNRVKTIVLIFIGILIIGQFIRPKQNISEGISENDISHSTTNADALSIIKNSCYDCHSNNTTYPWYSNIFPVSWYLYNHIEGGKKHLNFSEFGSYELKKKDHVLEEIKETIEEGEMPLSSYTILHSEAMLSDKDKEIIITWIKDMSK
jgi:hypothetical protein